MDRPSQKPPDRPGPPSEAGESPLSFPVETPTPTDPEPAAGEPLEFSPGSPPPAIPAVGAGDAASPPANPLAFPAEAAPPAGAFVAGEAVAPPASPPAFPAEAAGSGGAGDAVSQPANPLAFPVEAAPAHSVVAEDAVSQPATPLAFPAEAAPPAGPPPIPGASAEPFAFPAQATHAAPPAEQLPFPVAELPGSVTAGPPPLPAPDSAARPTSIPAEATSSGILRFLPPVLAAVAALMTAAGCFLPLFRLQQHVSVRQRFFEAQLTVTETAWGNRLEIPGQDAAEQGGSPFGIPLILAVLVLAVAAFTAFSRPGHGAGRWLIGAGAFFTAGVVTTVGMTGPGWSAMAEGVDLEVATASGMWLLIGATALAAVAAVLAYLPAWRRTEDWADPALAYADTPTPPTCVAITGLPPEEPG